MAPDTPNADPARPGPEGTGGADRAEDAEDWWDGKVDTSAPRPEATSTGAEAAPAEGATEATAPDAGKTTKQRLLVAAAAVVAVAGIGLAVARSSDDGADAATGGDATSDDAGGGPGDGPMRSGGGPGTFGSVGSVDPDGGTLTIEPQDGSGDGVEVVVADDTTISEMVEGSAADLAEGDSVLVVGSTGDGESGDGDAVEATQVLASSDGDLLDVGGPMVRPGGGGEVLGGPPEGDDMPEPPEGFEPGDGPPEGFEPNGDANREQQGPGGITSGAITSIDGDTLTVTTSDDETVTVTLSDDTTVVRSEERELSDLEEDDTVAVTGESDDGTVTARSIRVNPQMSGFPGGGPAGPGGLPGGQDGDNGDNGDSRTENETGA